MKRKDGLLTFIVLRFIAYSLGTELVISILEEIFRMFLPDIEQILIYDSVPDIASRMAPAEIVLVILWGLAELIVYCAGVVLFARSVHRRLQEQIRENEEQRLQLFSNIAHDLKTPLTTISGYAGALADGIVEDRDKQREYLLTIREKSRQMNQLTEQLLSYSKLGAAQYQPALELVDVAELLRAACASLFGEMENRQIELDLKLPDSPVFCKADSLELDRAIGNLLTNAIHHNPAGTLLSVALAEKPEHILIQIADSGTPVPETMNIFEPFVSGSDSRSSGHGTGLGLAIVKKAAERHGGVVFLSDAAAPYTKMFVVKLPKAREE